MGLLGRILARDGLEDANPRVDATAGAWRHLPPLHPSVSVQPLALQSARFEAALSSHHSPALLAPLVHDRSADHPAGLLEGIAVLSRPARAPVAPPTDELARVQRFRPPSSSARGRTTGVVSGPVPADIPARVLHPVPTLAPRSPELAEVQLPVVRRPALKVSSERAAQLAHLPATQMESALDETLDAIHPALQVLAVRPSLTRPTTASENPAPPITLPAPPSTLPVVARSPLSPAAPAHQAPNIPYPFVEVSASGPPAQAPSAKSTHQPAVPSPPVAPTRQEPVNMEAAPEIPWRRVQRLRLGEPLPSVPPPRPAPVPEAAGPTSRPPANPSPRAAPTAQPASASSTASRSTSRLSAELSYSNSPSAVEESVPHRTGPIQTTSDETDWVTGSRGTPVPTLGWSGPDAETRSPEASPVEVQLVASRIPEAITAVSATRSLDLQPAVGGSGLPAKRGAAALSHIQPERHSPPSPPTDLPLPPSPNPRGALDIPVQRAHAPASWPALGPTVGFAPTVGTAPLILMPLTVSNVPVASQPANAPAAQAKASPAFEPQSTPAHGPWPTQRLAQTSPPGSAAPSLHKRPTGAPVRFEVQQQIGPEPSVPEPVSGEVTFTVQRQGQLGATPRQLLPQAAASASTASSAPAGGQPSADATSGSSSSAAAAPGGGDSELDELGRKLYDRILDRLKAELYLDRERAGLLSDLTA